MKKLVPFLLAGMCACPVLAQQPAQRPALKPDFILAPSAVQYGNQPSALQPQGTLDTLDEYLGRSTGLGVYPYSIEAPGQSEPIQLPITGTNDAYIVLGTKYDFSGTATVRSLLVLYASKFIQGEPDTFTASVFSLGANGLPATQVGGQTFSTDQIDTSFEHPLLTVINFDTPAPVSSDFAVMVQTIDPSQGNDFDVISIFSNQQGDGKGEKRACVIGVDGQNQMYTANLADLFSTDTGPIDIDPMIFPVIETDAASGVNDAATLNGLTLRGAFPSPASDKTTLHFDIDKPASMDISLVDMTGRVVYSVRRDNMEAGAQAVDLDVSTLPAGSYFYTLSTGTAHMAGKLTVVK